jgi:NTE family protein
MSAPNQTGTPVPERAKKADLVLEGGGVKNIALLGAVTVLAEAGYTFPRVAGTSGGAIIAAGIAAYQKAGRDLGDLLDVSLRVDNSRFLAWRRPGRVSGPLSGALDLVRRGGLHSGDYLYEFLSPALAGVGVRTFGDLRIDDDPGSSLAEHQQYSLVIHVADITHQVLVRLPWDYPLYGIPADEQPIAEAVRASMSIPFFFRPVHVKTDHGAATWVDGGLLANYPITVFDRTDGKPPRWPTWGVKVSTSPPHGQDRPVRTAVGLGIRCLATVTGDWYRSSLGADTAGRRTIQVDTSGVSARQFDLDNHARLRLFENGRAAAAAFLERLPSSGGTV